MTLEDLAEEIKKDPKFLEKLQARQGLAEFKEKFNLGRSTPLKCPACSSSGMAGGPLWINRDDHKLFVCRRCRLEFRLECLTLDNDKLIQGLREVEKL